MSVSCCGEEGEGDAVYFTRAGRRKESERKVIDDPSDDPATTTTTTRAHERRTTHEDHCRVSCYCWVRRLLLPPDAAAAVTCMCVDVYVLWV